MNSVELINNGDGTWSVRVYNLIVQIGTREECQLRIDQEGEA